MSTSLTILLPFQPTSMSTAQLAAVSFLARYSGRTHEMYTAQMARWFAWCERNGLDPLVGIKRALVELYIRHLGEAGLMDSSIVTMMHGVRGYFRFAHIDGLTSADPAVYARLPKVQQDESRTQGLDRLELIRFLQVALGLALPDPVPQRFRMNPHLIGDPLDRPPRGLRILPGIHRHPRRPLLQLNAVLPRR